MTEHDDLHDIIYSNNLKNFNTDRIIISSLKIDRIIRPKGRPNPEREIQRVDLPPAEILAPLEAVFIPDELKDRIVSRVSIPELLKGVEPAYSGIILYGPPGTGKTVLLRAICDVYKRAGAYSHEVSVAHLNSCFVGQFARNLEQVIAEAVDGTRKTGKASFLAFDEASVLVEKASTGAGGVAKHYQEAIDVLKRYLGNERMLVMGVSTNELPEAFDDPLVREGRLTPYLIDFPDTKQRKRMWKHFSKNYSLIQLDDEQAMALAEVVDFTQGAFIEEFCRNYLGRRKKELLHERGYPTLVDSLKQGAEVTDEEARRSMTFGNFYNGVMKALQERSYRKSNEENRRIGFSTE